MNPQWIKQAHKHMQLFSTVRHKWQINRECYDNTTSSIRFLMRHNTKYMIKTKSFC